MAYYFLGTVFIFSLVLILAAPYVLVFPQLQKRSRIRRFYLFWFFPYLIFILFFTGPKDLSSYPPQTESPYKLPWQAGINRWTSQGNNSFTSHHDFYFYSWDFWMPIGTEVLAAREGRVSQSVDAFEGFGFSTNFVMIKHADGTTAGYAHIKKSLVQVGDIVKQGQPIALSGMVGQSVNPHLHFDVINKEGTQTIPISFSDVPGGIPLAGRFYTSENNSGK